ncbi:MAG TPA: hypothetical protein DDZ53_02185 [Firmicutes bacterium]|jgi:uncharacterized membrane protein|nr:hypothetical protein [Bacillota bacterium]
MLKTYLLALGLTTSGSGIIYKILLSRGTDAKYYLVAVSTSLFLAMLCAVILAVLWERPWQAPIFVGLAAAISALLFYRLELAAGYGPLATTIVLVVAFAVWIVAAVGCASRRRLRAMD